MEEGAEATAKRRRVLSGGSVFEFHALLQLNKALIDCNPDAFEFLGVKANEVHVQERFCEMVRMGHFHEENKVDGFKQTWGQNPKIWKTVNLDQRTVEFCFAGMSMFTNTLFLTLKMTPKITLKITSKIRRKRLRQT
tara:strand:+ start:238 stop:648 length:411 start_codon:yes stop_codon:yes gene_type:complete